jgi:hypothetical protein
VLVGARAEVEDSDAWVFSVIGWVCVPVFILGEGRVSSALVSSALVSAALVATALVATALGFWTTELLGYRAIERFGYLWAIGLLCYRATGWHGMFNLSCSHPCNCRDGDPFSERRVDQLV